MRQLIWIRTALAFLIGTSVTFAHAQDSLPPLAKIASVKASNVGTTRQFFGNVVAKETVDLAFQVGGQVVELPIVEGGLVPSGALIASLDREPFELALDQAQVQLEQSKRNFERLKQLQGSAVSQVSVDDAQTQFKLSEIAVRDAQRSLNNAVLVAPFDALVASRNVSKFSTISAGTPVVRLHDMSDLRIEIDVPEVLFQRAGQSTDVDLVAKFPSRSETYPLEVREYKAETSTVGQTYQITLGMTPPEDFNILPGSSVTVFATLNDGTSTIQVPSSAILNANDGTPQVMVFSPTGADEGTVQSVTVDIAPDDQGNVIVVSGLEEGQEIIFSGAHLLSDGDTVRRFTGFSN